VNEWRSTCTRGSAAWLLAIGLASLWPSAALATGPENTAVVVNADSWASLAVANEFVRLRGIPASHVICLEKLPSFERMDVDTFREKILWRVLETLDERKLTRQIDCIAYSADLPHTIDARKDLRGRKLPRMFTPICAINGLTYLHRLTIARNPNYLQLHINRYTRRLAGKEPVQPLSQKDAKAYAEAMERIKEEKWQEAADAIAKLAETNPTNYHMLYNLACCKARLGKPDEAVATLRRAVEAGWLDHAHASRDKDFASIRDREEFKQLIKAMRSKLFDVQPTTGFRGAYEWDTKGEKVVGGGQRYLLSTMLAVTSGRGNSVSEALAYLRRSAGADGTKPKGTIYFLRNGNVRSTTRHWAFRSTVAKLEAMGIRAEIAEGALPQKKDDVMGAVIGAAGFDWAKSGSTILPGAIVEHLTSCGGMMGERAGQTPLSELLRHGAAGASGTVAEPLAIQSKFPCPFIHVHYAAGCTLAEAFYQSVYGPYQLLIVGDPLCRPWATIPKVEVEGVKPGATVKGKLALTARSSVPARRVELFVDGLRVAQARPQGALELDTTGLADGWHELRGVAIAADAVETQGAAVIPVTVANHGHRLVLIAPSETTVAWDRPLKVGARLVGGAEIVLYHHGRPVGTIVGEQGQVELDPLRLGQGRVVLHAVGSPQGAPEAKVRSKPLVLDIVPPKALPAAERDPNAGLAAGLALVVEGGKPVVIEDTHRGDWLSKHVKEGQSFELTGWFDAPADDVYQFQLHSNVAIDLAVDGKALKQPAGDGWKFLPIALAKGSHVLRIKGEATARPRLDVRFGGPGCYRLSGKRFRHTQVN